MEDEELLAGGNASGPVVRVGSTVRKAWSAATSDVHAFMAALRESGIDVPAAQGPDEQGRQVLEFVPGRIALHAHPLTRPELTKVGAMVRALHDASEMFGPRPGAVWNTAIPAPGDDLVCHNDLAPWNLIVGDRWVFIDWDAAAPSTRLWDLAYAAQSFTLSDVRRAPEESALDLAALVDGYEADRFLRVELPAAMARRAAAMLELLTASSQSGREPWATMYAAGHGEHWRAATRYAERHRDVWSHALAER